MLLMADTIHAFVCRPRSRYPKPNERQQRTRPVNDRLMVNTRVVKVGRPSVYKQVVRVN